jgi:hypothetical protein
MRRLVFVTGDSLSASTAAFLTESGVPCITKPFLVEQLKSTVNAALAASERRDPESATRRRTGSTSGAGAKKR